MTDSSPSGGIDGSAIVGSQNACDPSTGWLSYPEFHPDMFSQVKRSAKLRRSGMCPKECRVERYCYDDIVFPRTMVGPILFDFESGRWGPNAPTIVIRNKLRYICEMEDTPEARKLNVRRLKGLEILYRHGLILARENPHFGGYDFKLTEEGSELAGMVAEVALDRMFPNRRGGDHLAE